MIIIKHPSETAIFPVEVELPDGVTINSASFNASGLTVESVSVEPDESRALVEVSGGTHGRTYQLAGSFNLSSGGPLIRTVTLRVSSSI